jgi:hypothetical protein
MAMLQTNNFETRNSDPAWSKPIWYSGLQKEKKYISHYKSTQRFPLLERNNVKKNCDHEQHTQHIAPDITYPTFYLH